MTVGNFAQLAISLDGESGKDGGVLFADDFVLESKIGHLAHQSSTVGQVPMNLDGHDLGLVTSGTSKQEIPNRALVGQAKDDPLQLVDVHPFHQVFPPTGGADGGIQWVA